MAYDMYDMASIPYDMYVMAPMAYDMYVMALMAYDMYQTAGGACSHGCITAAAGACKCHLQLV